jgi:GTPase SAR1 family protein
LKNVEDKWVAEVTHFCENVSIILVALKADLRQDPDTLQRLKEQGLAPITTQEGQKVADRIRAFKYIECSARTGAGVSQVFHAAAEAATVSFPARRLSKPRQSKKCALM